MSDPGAKSPSPLKISEMPAEERPREKLLARGASALIDPELIAILLGSGVRGANAIEVARQLLEKYRQTACTAAELQELHSWLDEQAAAGQPYLFNGEEEKSQLKNKIQLAVLGAMPAPAPVRKIKPLRRMRYAAAAVGGNRRDGGVLDFRGPGDARKHAALLRRDWRQAGQPSRAALRSRYRSQASAVTARRMCS